MSLIKVGRTPDFSNNELEKKLSIIQSKSSDEVFVGTLRNSIFLPGVSTKHYPVSNPIHVYIQIFDLRYFL